MNSVQFETCLDKLVYGHVKDRDSRFFVQELRSRAGLAKSLTLSHIVARSIGSLSKPADLERVLAQANAAPPILAVRKSPKGEPIPLLTISATDSSCARSAQAPEPPKPMKRLTTLPSCRASFYHE